MAVTAKKLAFIVNSLGVLSFMSGVIAENKKPTSGTRIVRKNVVICKYQSDAIVVFGYLSLGFPIASSFVGFTSGVATMLLLWPTRTKRHHILNNIHRNLKTECPTAKTGLLGGGVFVSLDASLFWLVALTMADNAREDCFEELENDSKGEYDQITTGEPNANSGRPKETALEA